MSVTSRGPFRQLLEKGVAHLRRKSAHELGVEYRHQEYGRMHITFFREGILFGVQGGNLNLKILRLYQTAYR